MEGSPYAGVYALAQRLRRGPPGAYALVLRIESFLRHGFRYSQQVPSSLYPLVTFLLGDHLGYCQQFSGAMALLLRMDGVPARVAAGFLPGERDPSNGLYVVSAREAHAWVEVFYGGIGWVPYDPTPPTPGGNALDPILAAEAGASGETLRHRALPHAHAASTPERARSRATAGSRSSSAPLEIAAAVVFGLALLAWLAGSARVDAALSNDGEGAVAELGRALPRLGLPLAAGITLKELETVLERSYGPRASRYARLLSARRYARDSDLSRPSPRDRRRLRAALSSGRGPVRRLRVLLALPPGTRRPRLRRRSATERATQLQ